jgi:hypothetical protein
MIQCPAINLHCAGTLAHYECVVNPNDWVVYVTNLGWSNEEFQIRTLNWSALDLKNFHSVTLLGSPGKLSHSQTAEGLTIQVPSQAPYDSPVNSFKLAFPGPIPSLKP